MERRLAAILAADVVGYSRLMGEDEAETLVRLKKLRKDLVQPIIIRRNGRIVKLMGDGLLAEFRSVVEAVQCATEIQDHLARHETDLPAERRILLRIGVNLGDIIAEGGDIYGDGVNVAARLEELAEPGGICISGKVLDEVKSKTELNTVSLGNQRVKNIADPLSVHKVELDREFPASAAQSRPIEKPAVAVLPFENLSGDPDQLYFSDGLSEDIITLLSAWHSFPVISRNSSFAFKGQHVDIRQIAKDLSARYVIEGSVRRSGNRVRVTAQLIDAEKGHHLWADKFDRALDDIFEIQDEITRQIVSAVEPEMERAERNKTATTRASNLSAWDCYLRGREFLHKLTPPDNANARAMFEKAIELDPKYSDAFAGLASGYMRDILLEAAGDRKAWEEKAFIAARQAVSLDNSSSIAHLALGTAYIYRGQHQLSIAETRTAVELNPSNTPACLALGNRLDIVGASDEGIPLLEDALSLHPRDPISHLYFGLLARAYINAHEYEKALSCLTEAIRRQPEYPHTYYMLAICMGHLGNVKEAREAARRCDQLHPGFIRKRTHWNIYLDPDANHHLTEGLRKAGLVE